MTALPLTTSYWPADTSSPLLETTIGGVLRGRRTCPRPARADLRRPGPGAAAAVALRRAARRGRARRPRAVRAIQARRPGRGMGGQLPRVGDARVRRRAGRGDAGH